MWGLLVSAAIQRVNSPGYRQPVRVVMVTLSSTRVCLAWIAPGATRPIIGLQDTMVRTLVLQMKAEEVSIMVARRAVIVIPRPCILPRVQRATTGIPEAREVAEVKVVEEIDL